MFNQNFDLVWRNFWSKWRVLLKFWFSTKISFFLIKISIFDQNFFPRKFQLFDQIFDIGPKFWIKKSHIYLPKWRFFDQNFTFRAKFHQISIYDQNLFFLLKISIFHQILDHHFNFRSQFKFSTKISPYHENFDFWSIFFRRNTLIPGLITSFTVFLVIFWITGFTRIMPVIFRT